MRETLFLDIIMFEKVVRTMLIIKWDDEQKPVYYTSKALHGVELWYQKIENLSYEIMLAARRLKPYVQSHPI